MIEKNKMRSTFTCHKCGSINQMGDHACSNCGAAFQYSCPQCNFLLQTDDKVCARCGNTIIWSEYQNQQANQSGNADKTKLPSSRSASWLAPFAGLTIVAVTGLIVAFAVYSMWQIPNVPPAGDILAENKTDNVPIDLTPPVISNVAATTLPGNGVEISWTTDEPSTSQVIWNTSDATSGSTQQKDAMVKQHSCELGNLQTGLMYSYVVKSIDATGNEAISDNRWFTIGKQPGIVRMAVQMHSMYIEGQSQSSEMKTYIRGKVINNGSLPVDVRNIEVTVKYTIPGKGVGEVSVAVDPYPYTVNPGETHPFYVIVPNGTEPSYTVTVNLIRE